MTEEKDPFEPIVGKYNFPGKNERDILSAIVRALDNGIMSYCSSGKMSVTQYLESILRSKGELNKNQNSLKPNQWSNDKFLGRLEKTNEELFVSPPDLWGNDELDTYEYKRKF